jgi:hypothetical protein
MANTYTLIASSTAGSGGVSNITFSSIPQTFTDLKLVLSIRGSRALVYNVMKIKFNGVDTNQTSKVIEGNGAAAASFSDTFISVIMSGASATANTFGSGEVYIPNYTSSNYKSVLTDSVAETNAVTQYIDIVAGLWSSTAAITSITIDPNVPPTNTILEHSTAYLYGIKKS